MSGYVTDPELLKTLNGNDYVTDPELLAQLDGNKPPESKIANRIGFMDILKIANEVADKVSPLGILKTANNLGNDVARKEGDYLGDATFDATGSPELATAAKLSPDIANIVVGNRLAAISPKIAPNNILDQAATRIGFKPDLAQRSGSVDLNNFYDTLRNMPGSAGVIARHEARNTQAINRAAAKDIGQNADSVTGDILAAAKSELGSTRNALKSNVDIQQNAQTVLDTIDSQATKLSTGLRSSSQFDNYARKIKDSLSSGSIKGDQYQQWRTDLRNLKDAAYKADRSNLGDAYNSLIKSLDEAAMLNAGPEWRANNKAFSSLELLKDSGAVNDITGDVSPQKLTNAYYRQFGDAALEGRLDGGIPDIATVTKGYKPRAEGSQTARREAYSSVVPWLMSPASLVAAKALTSSPQDLARLLMYGNPIGGIAQQLSPYLQNLVSSLRQGQSQ